MNSFPQGKISVISGEEMSYTTKGLKTRYVKPVSDVDLFRTKALQKTFDDFDLPIALSWNKKKECRAEGEMLITGWSRNQHLYFTVSFENDLRKFEVANGFSNFEDNPFEGVKAQLEFIINYEKEDKVIPLLEWFSAVEGFNELYALNLLQG